MIGKCSLYRSSEIQDIHIVHYKLNHNTYTAMQKVYTNAVSYADMNF